MKFDPREFVRKWLTIKEIIINECGELQSADKRNNKQIFDWLFLDYNEQVTKYNYDAKKSIKAATEGLMHKALEELIFLHEIESRKQLFNKIIFSGVEDLSLLEQFVKAMTGTNDPTTVGVFAHFLCGIKRKLLGLETAFQIMPIILGKQEGGKSYSLEKLLLPIKNLTMQMNLDKVLDDRNFIAYGTRFAIIINEMAGANKADVEKLKNLITTGKNDVRKLHTNDVLSVKQNTSLIGTTNKPVAQIIYDPSGMRRFYEIKALDLLDWEIIENLDYFKLWQGINENRPRGYYEEYRAGIKENQAELTGLEEIQVFLDFYKVRPGNKEISGAVLYDAYKTWCESNGVKNILNSVWFSRNMVGKGFKKPYQKSRRGTTTQIYTIGEEATELHSKDGYNPMRDKEYQ